MIKATQTIVPVAIRNNDTNNPSTDQGPNCSKSTVCNYLSWHLIDYI